MTKVFLYSDPHFGHLGVCKFLSKDGVTKLRPWDNPEEMNEEMVKRYNDTVGKNDKCYFLGDVVINRKALSILGRLNGDKVLIKGNHDIFKLSDYAPYFRDIRAYHVMNRMILSHIPVHESQKGRFTANIHGHTHDRSLDDPWYHCVCVEQTDFRPVLFYDVVKKIQEKQSD